MVSAVLIIGLVFVTDAKPHGDEENWLNPEKERHPAYLPDDDILYDGQCYYFYQQVLFCNVFQIKTFLINFVL